MSSAFWNTEEDSERSALETLSIVSVLDLSPERALEKAARALLEKARSSANHFRLDSRTDPRSDPRRRDSHPGFFHLSLEARMALVAIHQGKWSYEKLARILQIDSEGVEDLLWKARVLLVTDSSQLRAGSFKVKYPSAPYPISPSCPEYDNARPWTQRLLDGEIPAGKEQFFLKEHLVRCKACKECFVRCKEIYYRVNEAVDDLVGSRGSPQRRAFQDLAESVVRDTELRVYPSRMTFLGSLKSLWVRKSEHFKEAFEEKNWVLLLGLALCALALLLKWKKS